MKTQKGFSLVEVMVAVGFVAIVIIGGYYLISKESSVTPPPVPVFNDVTEVQVSDQNIEPKVNNDPDPIVDNAIYIEYGCGPHPDGGNTCLDPDRVAGEYYTKCESDRDCLNDELCKEIHSLSGDVAEFSVDVCQVVINEEPNNDSNNAIFVKNPCGTTPDGGTTCSDPNWVAGEYYTKCESDRDCTDGKLCKLIESFSGDAGLIVGPVCQ